MLLHRMTLISFRLFRENLGNMRELFGQIVLTTPPPPPWQKIARTPMCSSKLNKIKITLRMI